eukprot:NP_001246388.1 uncharacterized protein Dmel_CG43272, isoform A [Drosophila melanogaster]
MRRRYDKEQKPGVIRQWMKATTKKPTTARGPCFQREQAYTGNWFGYNAGYGRNETRR